MSVVEFQGFTFTYPGSSEPALSDLSFEVRAGELLGLVGSVGAGKSTALRAMAGLVPSLTGGDVKGHMLLGGAAQEKAGTARAPRPGQPEEPVIAPEGEGTKAPKVGVVFEKAVAQLTQLMVLDEVMTPLIERGFSEGDARARAKDLLRCVGLEPDGRERERVWELPEGEQLRLAVAAVLALDPDILAFDAILDRLDPWEQRRIIEIARGRAGEKTVIIAEHDVRLLGPVVDRLIVLLDGRVAAAGPPEIVLRDFELLTRSRIAPPLPLRLARAVGAPGFPITADELESALELPYGGEASGVPELSAPPSARGSPRTGPPALEVRDLTFRYAEGEPDVLIQVGLAVFPGEVHGVVGRSGAGKTTLIQVISGLLGGHGGRVRVTGQDLEEKRALERARVVGTVLDDPNTQLSERTVAREIEMPLRRQRRGGILTGRPVHDEPTIRARRSKVMDLVGLDEGLADCDPFLLPRGIRRLVTIATVLVVDPPVLLLDEPEVGLGEATQTMVAHLIGRVRDLGKAVLLAGNDTNFLGNVADTVTVLHEGRVERTGPVEEVFGKLSWSELEGIHLPAPDVVRLAERFGLSTTRYDVLCRELSSRLALRHQAGERDPERLGDEVAPGPRG